MYVEITSEFEYMRVSRFVWFFSYTRDTQGISATVLLENIDVVLVSGNFLLSLVNPGF